MENAPVVAETTIDTVAQTTGMAAQQPSSLFMWGYIIIIFGVLYFFMYRPNKKRMVEYKKMLDSIQVGNRVLAAGIYGTVKKVNEKSIDVEIAKGVVVEINKNAVANVE